MQRPSSSSNHALFIGLGVALAILGGSCETIGISMAVSSKKNQVDAGIFFAIFSLVIFLVPSAILFTVGFGGRKKLARMQKLAALGAVSSRMPIDAVAHDLGLAPAAARDLILEAVGTGLLRGRLDLEHGVFVSATADTAVQQMSVFCRSCGANAQVVVTPGQWVHCPYCKAPIR